MNIENKRFRIWEISLMLALCVTLCLGTWAQARQESISGSLVRLHVLAVSDDSNEQRIKLNVRDSVLSYISPKLEGAESPDEAKRIISSELDGIMSAAETAAETTEVKSFSVAIVQQLSHSSLDEIHEAISAELKARAEAAGVELTISDYNGQNDTTMLGQIGAQALDDKVDMIIPIATLAAQTMVTAAEGTGTPIVYAACSDPETAGLTGLDNVTGTSDALNTPFILDMMLAVNPQVKTVGLLYSNSEINSAAPIAEAKAYLGSKGIAYLEKTGTNANEIIAAASDLVGRVDAVFTPTDNQVMSVENTVAEILAEAKIPHYTGADSFVQSGAFATCGVNYTELGEKTAQMAMDILLGGAIGSYQVMDGGIITVNTDTAATLGLDYSPFAKMANTLLKVTSNQ